MAQNFRNNLQSAVGTGPVTLVTGANYDAVIGIRLCNILTSTIEVDVYIINSGNKYLAKDVVIPPNSAIELIQGGAKIVLKNGDVLKAVSNTASSGERFKSYSNLESHPASKIGIEYTIFFVSGSSSNHRSYSVCKQLSQSSFRK